MHPNKTQLQHFEMLRNSSFNAFDADIVIAGLMENTQWWRAALMTADARFILRDLTEDFWAVDTLYIRVAEGHEEALEELARTWQASEVDWLEADNPIFYTTRLVGHTDDRLVLRVWWD